MKTIIANPPFSMNWDSNPNLLNDPRFEQFGKLAPKSKADFAFIQDMIYSLDNEGIMSVVLPHGVLFRGATEQHIRRYIIEKLNCLDAVIGLPANLFFGTNIPTCILIFKKNRLNTDGVVFINASNEFEKQRNKSLLTIEHILKIANTYHKRLEIEKYSYVATLSEISENDYNLNIPRYVDVTEVEPDININEVMQEIKSLEAKRDELDKEISVYLKELGIDY